MQAHKAVLLAWSEAFEKLITGAGLDVKELPVKVVDEDKPNFKHLIRCEFCFLSFSLIV